MHYSMLTVKLKDGLGNRLFQVAALLHYAEKWGLEPVFFPGRCDPCTHDGANAETIFALFPQIRVEWSIGPVLTTVRENHRDCFKYVERVKPLTEPNTPIVLDGYFQASSYVGERPSVPNYRAVIGTMRANEIEEHYRNVGWWVHVRLGDYMVLPHYQIDLRNYLSRAISKIPIGARVIVYSDSPQVALSILEDLVSSSALTFEPAWSSLKAVETLYAMSLAREGCICTNSTFSWWGAAGSSASSVYFPGKWMNDSSYDVIDVYPSWGVKII